MVELPLPGTDEHIWIGELAIVDLGARQLERHGGYRGQVLDEQDRQTLRSNLVDRTERNSHAVRESQVLVDERPGWQRGRVQLPGREQDLPVLAVDLVAVVVHRYEVVVGADLLNGAE